MKNIYRFAKYFILLLIFWVLLFDFQRSLFSIHNWSIVSAYPFLDWIQVFFHSFRLDIAMGSYLSLLPLVILTFYFVFQRKFIFTLFKYFVLFEVLLVALIQAGEINAYPEWKHKLTTGVFIHFFHIGEMFRTADASMTFWFFVYTLLQLVFGWRIFQWFFKKLQGVKRKINPSIKVLLFMPVLPLFLGLSFLFMRGGFQQIPINIDAAYYSKNYVINDISVNSTYFFGKSFLLFNRSDIGKFLSHYNQQEIDQLLPKFERYNRSPKINLLKTKRPNLVFVILEGWSATASHAITGKPGVTPTLDSLAQHGVLFTNIYSTGTTSEVGNSTILSGYPALPEISITMQPYKNRSLKSINQTLAKFGYTSGYYFSGDLKYGNIESYLMTHNFNRIHDENDFPKGLDRGKLNYYDADLFRLFLHEINHQKEPFIECTFTGSTHSPFDCPQPKRHHWEGAKYHRYMNSVLYSNECISNFIQKASQQPWYKNTLFVFVADHGHGTPYVSNPNNSTFFHIPLLFFGPALKDSVKGMRISTLGSQADIVQTLLQNMGIDAQNDYPWSKNLLSEDVPQFALNATSRGFGWITPKGHFTYHFDYQKYIINAYSPDELVKQRKRCNAFMQLLYQQYKHLGQKKALSNNN